MGADWYFIQGFYGYEIKITPSSFKDIVKVLINLQGIIDDRLEYAAILSEFHSRMEGMDENELKDMYEHSSLIIGFKTVDDLSKMIELADYLKEYIKNIPFFELEFYENPGFFYGMNVIESVYDMFYHEDDNETESEDSEEESKSNNEENEENTSDEDEEKVAPEMEYV
jgi:hypothetical protein